MSQRLYGICRATMHWQLLNTLQRPHYPRSVITRLMMTLCLPILAGADEKQDIYSWRDAAGILHFADRPADSYPSRLVTPPRAFGVIQQPDPVDAQVPASEPTDAPAEITTLSTPRPKPSPNPRAEQLPDYTRNCTNARESLRQLDQFKRIRVKNSSGQDVFLTRNERQSLIDAAQQAIRNNCTKI